MLNHLFVINTKNKKKKLLLKISQKLHFMKSAILGFPNYYLI